MTSAPAGATIRQQDTGDWGPLLRGELRAGRLLVRLPVAAATAMLLGAAICAPLALAHLWRPVIALPVLALVIAVGVRASVAVYARPVPPWILIACLLIAAGAGVWAGATHDEHVVIRRDAGSYALYGQALASHHQLPINAHVAALGGSVVRDNPDVTLASPAYFETGHGDSTVIQPQFVVGVPAWLSVGMWLGGWTGLLLMPALFTALALLAVAALAVATIGPRWAPLAMGATAVTQPMIHAARSTYSEPAALLALAAGLTLLASATEAGVRGRADRAARMGLLAGLLLGGGGLIRIDALRDCVLVIPVIVIFALRRHPAAARLAIGLLGGLVVAAAIDLTLSRIYLDSVKDSLYPLVALAAVLALAGLALVAVVRRRSARRGATTPPAVDAFGNRAPWAGRGSALLRPVPILLALLVALVAAAITTRPWWMHAHQDVTLPSTPDIAALQRNQGLGVDGTLTYAEHSATWVVWWIGPAAALLGVAGACLAAYRTGRILTRGQRLPSWLGPYAVAAGSIVLVLWRPGITPDHPWADRRLVVEVLPGLLLLGTAAVAALVRLARRHAPLPVLGLAVLIGAAALILPAFIATAPVLTLRTELGEVGAVDTVCRSFHPGDVALIMGPRAANEWPEVIRTVCNIPTAVVEVPGTDTTTTVGRADLAAALAKVVPEVRAAGSTPVLISDRQDLLTALGTTPTQLVNLSTQEDPRLLTRRPAGSAHLVISLWAAAPAG